MSQPSNSILDPIAFLLQQKPPVFFRGVLSIRKQIGGVRKTGFQKSLEPCISDVYLRAALRLQNAGNQPGNC